jgi:uncharacterized protein
MLKVDLALLWRQRHVQVDVRIPTEDDFWAGMEAAPITPLDVTLTAQAAGPDVVVRGRVRTVVALPCRRCLAEVRRTIDEEVTLVFRRDVDVREAEQTEVYPIADRAAELDLMEPLREQVLLAMPAFATCAETCRGICPGCGADLNAEECRCDAPEPDERWAALRRLELD